MLGLATDWRDTPAPFSTGLDFDCSERSFSTRASAASLPFLPTDTGTAKQQRASNLVLGDEAPDYSTTTRHSFQSVVPGTAGIDTKPSTRDHRTAHFALGHEAKTEYGTDYQYVCASLGGGSC